MEPTPSTPVSPHDPDLAAEVRGLKSLFYAAITALIVMGVGLNIYLGKQMRLARAQLSAQQRSMDESERVVGNFARAMNGFAATNQDFQPIFDKYRLVFSNYVANTALPAKP